MATTEATILNNYLIVPSQLPAFISLQEFTELFPKAHRSSPLIRSLYRDLQSQRNAVVDEVSQNVHAEVKSSKAMRQAVVLARRQEQAEGYDNEMAIHAAMVGASGGTSGAKQNLQSILPHMEKAVEALEKELLQLEKQEAKLLASVKQTVGNMSDLRYGRLANGQLRDQILEGHANLQETCKRKV
ncbi:hypothetical protein GQ53DRAFT_816813 [Thozetella sp. PMI_491]|nr:hypothetical protein GQ53DRAFT_816813 [Thozetella sp. PMI_491]